MKTLLGAAIALGVVGIGVVVLKATGPSSSSMGNVPAAGTYNPMQSVVYQPAPAQAPAPVQASDLPKWAQTTNAVLNLAGSVFNTGLGILKGIKG